MHITLDIDQISWQNEKDEVNVTVIGYFTHNKREYVREICVFQAPKYQAIAMQRALKDANPEDYKSNVSHLKLVKSDELVAD